MSLARRYFEDKLEYFKVWFDETASTLKGIGLITFWVILDVWICTVLVTRTNMHFLVIVFIGGVAYPQATIILYAVWRDWSEFKETLIYAICEECDQRYSCCGVFTDAAFDCAREKIKREMKKQNDNKRR